MQKHKYIDSNYKMYLAIQITSAASSFRIKIKSFYTLPHPENMLWMPNNHLGSYDKEL